MFKPITVTALPGYRLRVAFPDGVAGEVDLSHLAGKGVFSLWNDIQAFEQVSIGEGGEIKWSEEVDICPDAVYLQISGKSPEEVFPSLSEAATHA